MGSHRIPVAGNSGTGGSEWGGSTLIWTNKGGSVFAQRVYCAFVQRLIRFVKTYFTEVLVKSLDFFKINTKNSSTQIFFSVYE